MCVCLACVCVWRVCMSGVCVCVCVSGVCVCVCVSRGLWGQFCVFMFSLTDSLTAVSSQALLCVSLVNEHPRAQVHYG